MGESRQITNQFENNLTRKSRFSLRISPDFMCAASATQSASVTPQLLALVSSLSTSNFSLPNFTLAMDGADAAVGPALRLSKIPEKCACAADTPPTPSTRPRLTPHHPQRRRRRCALTLRLRLLKPRAAKGIRIPPPPLAKAKAQNFKLCSL
jgi:hypothetical protein